MDNANASAYCLPSAQLSEHFTVAEFTASDLAARHGVDNRLPQSMFLPACVTAQMLERVRHALSVDAGREIPVIVTSAWRCQALNRLVGSSDTSDHPRMLAVDFVAPSYGTPYQVAMLLAEQRASLGLGQVIHEFGRWVHVSRGTPARAINAVITIDRVNGTQRVRAGVQPVA